MSRRHSPNGKVPPIQVGPPVAPNFEPKPPDHGTVTGLTCPLPDGTGGNLVSRLDAERAETTDRQLQAQGLSTWSTLTRALVMRALATQDRTELRRRLGKAREVIDLWIDDIDRRQQP